jgi:hypothetical protein
VAVDHARNGRLKDKPAETTAEGTEEDVEKDSETVSLHGGADGHPAEESGNRLNDGIEQRRVHGSSSPNGPNLELKPHHSPGAIALCCDSRDARAVWIVDGNKTVANRAAISAPMICAATNAGTWLIAIPAKVVVKPRASVTAGFANEVDEVNQ